MDIARLEQYLLAEKCNHEYLVNLYESWKKKLKVNLIVAGISFTFFMLLQVIQLSLGESLSKIENYNILVVLVVAMFFNVNIIITAIAFITALVKVCKTGYKLWLNSDDKRAVNFALRHNIETLNIQITLSGQKMARYMIKIENAKNKA